METSKAIKDKHDVLQRIPIESNYADLKEFAMSKFPIYSMTREHLPHAPWYAVNGAYYYVFEEEMDENGMEKLALMIAGTLYQMGKCDVDPDQAYGTNWDIEDFDTGNYDDLFTEEDIHLIREDIAKIKEYLSLHPELLEENEN